MIAGGRIGMLGRFGKVPLDLDAAWYRVSYFARALAMDMIAHCAVRNDTADELRIPTATPDWAGDICLKLAVCGGNDRRTARLALKRLQEARLITVGDGFVQVNLAPSRGNPSALQTSTQCTLDVPPALTPCTPNVFNPSQTIEITQFRTGRQTERQTERHVRETRPSNPTLAKRAPRDELVEHIRDDWAKGYKVYHEVTAQRPSAQRAGVLAKWCRDNAERLDLKPRELAQEVMGAYLDSDDRWLKEQRWPFGVLVRAPEKYAPLPAQQRIPEAIQQELLT